MVDRFNPCQGLAAVPIARIRCANTCQLRLVRSIPQFTSVVRRPSFRSIAKVVTKVVLGSPAVFAEPQSSIRQKRLSGCPSNPYLPSLEWPKWILGFLYVS